MTTAERTADLPAASLDASRREQTIEQLNKGLATMADLGLIAKQAHWNVRGPNFQGLHELLDVIAAEVREWSDMLAERAVTLGGTAHGTSQDIVKKSALKAFPSNEHRWEALTTEVYQRMYTAGEQLRGFAGDLEDELITQDLVIEIVQGLEKRAWMLRSHLDR